MRIPSKPTVIRKIHRTGKNNAGPGGGALSSTSKTPESRRQNTDQNPNTHITLKNPDKAPPKPGLARWRHSAPFISQFMAQMRIGRRLPSERPEAEQVNRRYQTTSRLKQQSEKDASTVRNSRIV